MRVCIPTRDRVDAQFTWDNLTEELKKITHIVCPPEEVAAHVALGRRVLARPPLKLAGVRQWLTELSDEPLVMLDDDLSFFVRKDPERYNLTPAKGEALNEIFNRLNDLVEFDGYAHAGLSPRQMNNQHFPATLIYTSRMNAVHCVDPSVLRRENIRYDAVDMMEDYHVVLSLFEKGYDNAVLADAAWDQNRGSGAPGGFSHYRNQETQTAAALRLAELHPDFVKVVEKEPKTGSGGFAGKRTDVRVQWKKALASAAPVVEEV